MQSSKEQQGEIRKPSSMINAKKQRKTIERERLEIFSGKRDTKGTFYANMGTIKDRNGMDLIDREPDKLWTEVHDIVQETGIKTIAMEKKSKKKNGFVMRPYKSL